MGAFEEWLSGWRGFDGIELRLEMLTTSGATILDAVGRAGKWMLRVLPELSRAGAVLGDPRVLRGPRTHLRRRDDRELNSDRPAATA